MSSSSKKRKGRLARWVAAALERQRRKTPAKPPAAPESRPTQAGRTVLGSQTGPASTNERSASAAPELTVSLGTRPDEAPPAPPLGSLRKPSPAPGPALPDGALASLTISGGLAFSQREIVVYDDGRVTLASVGAGRGQSQRSTHLGDDQMAAVRDEIARLQPSAFEGRVVPASPDSYSYEVAVRMEDKVAGTTVSTGSMPPELAPLVRVLRDLAPEE